MSNSSITCPVCGHTLSAGNTFCEECGFEIHYLTEPVSPKVSSYEEQRKEHHRSLLDKYSSLEADYKSSLAAARNEADSSKEKVSSLEEELRSEKKDRELLESDLSRESQTNASLTVEIGRLQKENEMRKDVKPIASLFAVRGNIRRIYFLYDGDNLFGASSSSSSTATPVNISSSGLVQDHFRIKVNEEEGSIRIEAVNGEVVIPSSRHSLSNGDRFKAGNVEFTLFVN